MSRRKTAWLILAALTVSGLSCSIFSMQSNGVNLPSREEPAAAAPAVIAPSPDLVALEDRLVQLYEQVNGGVVSLQATVDDGRTQGSGFVFDQEGHIVTNYHVVLGVEELEVAFSSGVKARAAVIGTDADSDLAVIKVDVPAELLQPLPLSDSDAVKVGQTVIAIGNPFGFRGTMTLGIVSSLGRSMQSLHDAPGGGTFSAGDIIQTDAAINPGNSGGPLLNLNGEVIGVNRAIFTESFSSGGEPMNSGIGFAISANIARRVVPALIAEGRYDYPYIGINSKSDLTLAEQEILDLPQHTGVYVLRAVPGGPADEAGVLGGSRDTERPDLQAGGDLITAIDGKEVMNFDDFISYLVRYKSPGDSVMLTILRGGQTLEITVALDRRPGP